MIRRIFTFLLWGCILPSFAANSSDPADNSRAGADGPHVFYRGSKIMVKYVVMRDTGAKVITQYFDAKNEISLTCTVPETGDKFTFPLKELETESPAIYAETPQKMLALSDIEGNFKAFKTMLTGAGVIDAQFNWIYKKGHLVLVGDFFDRGLNVTECLWLIYKLEAEAAASGGAVHFILGNHEVMNLQGNTTYVRRKYLENAKRMNEEYKFWYDNNSELGRWLRTKNAVEKIGDYIFCHGGFSPDLSLYKLSLQDINRLARQNLGKQDYAIQSAEARAIFDTKTGIFWYRGLAKNLVSPEEFKRILQQTGGKRIVIGHTIQSDLTANYGGKVICIDLYHEENLRQGFMKTLYIEDGFCYALDSKGFRSSVFSVSFPQKKTN
ncbi:MAG: metallophosphoesterase [Saprospiraceae bacterium]|nr:metallophosphoesterase [Saprospiraceae bacterium]